MNEAKKILDKHIQNFYKNDPMARFDDIPNKVFLEAMIEYGNLVKKWFMKKFRIVNNFSNKTLVYSTILH